jgi:hypothetical protein
VGPGGGQRRARAVARHGRAGPGEQRWAASGTNGGWRHGTADDGRWQASGRWDGGKRWALACVGKRSITSVGV